MHVVIAGSSGFLGQHLSSRLESAEHEVTRLVRRPAQTGESTWDPYAGSLNQGVIDAADAVVNLAGSPTLGNPHSRSWATELRQSRVRTTQVLAEAIARSADTAFIAGNGIAYYGDHGNTEVTERAESLGTAFMTDVTREWEAATEPAGAAGRRVVIARTSPVMDRHNAPLKQLATLFRLGLGARLGDGSQYFPMISLRDWVGGIIHAIEGTIEGPVNLCCPQTPTNAEFTRALAAAVGRKALFSVPEKAIKVGAGRMASELVGSVNAVPQALMDSGYAFVDANVDQVINSGLAIN